MQPSRRGLLTSLLASPLLAQQQKKQSPAPYPPVLDGATQRTYKTIGGVDLNLWIFQPPNHQPSAKRPAIVFFFGGGWTNGTPKQFEQHCKFLSARGMVAITADYRVASRHQVKVVDCIRDAKSAMRYVRAQAASLGIDPARIAAGGGSAGGHLAAATGVIEGLEEPAENRGVSSRPNALVLFNPALVLADAPEAGVSRGEIARLEERFGAKPEAVSPYHHVGKGAPPAIIFHGKSDTTVPYSTAEAFTRKMQSLGNRCELDGYEGQTHGFFNYGRGDNTHYEKTIQRTAAFLTSLGYLQNT
ncbi:MAG: alpha/beta hydrolase [Bryobacterales bacterium]|nr:alpha/beta hydrolase [Bryobacterales bacterium]